MDKRETTKLFRFLGQIYPNAQEFSQETAMLAWQLVLEPYAYEDVKAAALDWARNGEKQTYPPRVSELTEKLTPPNNQIRKNPQTDSGYAWQRAIDAGICRDAADEMGSASRYARDRGISWGEAKERIGGGEIER